MDLVAGLGLDISEILKAVSRLNWVILTKSATETVVIVYAAFWLWGRIKGTQAERLVKGVMVLLAICIVSYLAGFTIITAILQHVIPVFVLALLIIFQPEIRRGLGYLGRGTSVRLDLSLADSEKDRTRQAIHELITAVQELKRRKIGALIVVEPMEGERDYVSPGVPVNADVSSQLILSIFQPQSPLHDGALVVRKNKIVAAGVILPMTDNPRLSNRYGTRHRAAIGLSEIYDGLCIVVSEETGSISAASRGMLVRYNSADELSDPLAYLLTDQTADSGTSTPLQSLFALVGWRKRQPDLTTGDTASGPDASLPDRPGAAGEPAGGAVAGSEVEPEPEGAPSH